MATSSRLGIHYSNHGDQTLNNGRAINCTRPLTVRSFLFPFQTRVNSAVVPLRSGDSDKLEWYAK
jgi:hypothetical protein